MAISPASPSPFDGWLFIDWSAASVPSPAKPSANAIWVACQATPGRPAGSHYFRTRADAMTFVKTIARRFITAEKRLLIGIDIALGSPRGLPHALTGEVNSTWQDIWRLIARELIDGDDNANNRFQVAARLNQHIARSAALQKPPCSLSPRIDGPYWGSPFARSDADTSPYSPGFPYPTPSGFSLARQRMVETLAPGTQETWKLCGIGSVGSQSLTGIAHLERLRQSDEFRDHLRIWPFETGWQVPTQRPLVVVTEIWPGLLRQQVAARELREPGRIRDELQVLEWCRWAREQSRCGQLATYFERPVGLSQSDEQAALSCEGWILGVTAAG